MRAVRDDASADGDNDIGSDDEEAEEDSEQETYPDRPLTPALFALALAAESMETNSSSSSAAASTQARNNASELDVLLVPAPSASLSKGGMVGALIATTQTSYIQISTATNTSTHHQAVTVGKVAADVDNIHSPAISPNYNIKRACQPSDKRAPINAIQKSFSAERDEIGLVEYRLKSSAFENIKIGACALCDPDSWTFKGSQYDPFLTLLYAERDGCIPSSVVTRFPKFIVPWRYKNKRTGEITWKIFHLTGDKITSADSETIVVNPARDQRLRHAMRRATLAKSRFKNREINLIEHLLKIIRETLGDYGLPGGSSSSEADARLFQQMQIQGSNFMLLCDVEVGLCRHKALLFKILCDAVDVNCALVTGYSTAGRHQWNIITLPGLGDFLIDPTSPHFTWTTKGSLRTKGYRVTADTSFGHSGFTQKEAGII